MLAGAALVLALVVLIDYGGLNLSFGRSSENRPKEVSSKIEQALELVSAADQIDRAYRQAAVSYAEMAADLWTFALEGGVPEDSLSAAIQDRLPAHVALEELVVGQPVARGPGVYSLNAHIKLSATSARELLELFWGMGEPTHGLAWKRFVMHGDPEARRISLDGELQAVIVEAVE